MNAINNWNHNRGDRRSFKFSDNDISNVSSNFSDNRLNNVYVNFLLDDDSFMNDKLNVLSHDINYSNDSAEYRNHLRFMNYMIKTSKEGEVYRFINKDIIEKNLTIIDSIKADMPSVYSKLVYTMNTLKAFLMRLNEVIGDKTVDAYRVNESHSNPNIQSLRYGITLLNCFKLFLDDLTKR